ncbi:evC complex member EVC-like [Boleophthalmus pectinirostris]|uniref:evC complex member EVC-like n=1 Tax=Boleophthalmus pectinirostris TaxID=150288 RepID=UPI0024314221|nr:evC complex member EVC-like [Boleophthalmus pectinirostris]
MSEREAPWECEADVSVSFPRSGLWSPGLGSPELLHIYPGLLALSSACGVLTGALTAALLLRVCVQHFILHRQGPRLLEPEEPEEPEEPKEPEPQRSDQGRGQGRSQGAECPHVSSHVSSHVSPHAPVNSNIAAFASRARVVYPISQKYRPLADGASNPSLHETGLSPHPTAPPPGSSPSPSCSDDDDDDDEDDDGEGQNGGGHFMCSAPQRVFRFTPVSSPLLALTQSGCALRVSVYFWALAEVRQLCLEQQEERAQVLSQIVKQVSGGLESDVYTELLQRHTQELNEWNQPLPSCSDLTSDPTRDLEDRGGGVTVEEVERWQKEMFQQQLQQCQSFSEQLECFSQRLSVSSAFSPEAPQILSSIHKSLFHLEKHLQSHQETRLTVLLLL